MDSMAIAYSTKEPYLGFYSGNGKSRNPVSFLYAGRNKEETLFPSDITDEKEYFYRGVTMETYYELQYPAWLMNHANDYVAISPELNTYFSKTVEELKHILLEKGVTKYFFAQVLPPYSPRKRVTLAKGI
jgi:hypothetical protein